MQLLELGSNMGIWDWDLEREIKWWSDRFYALLGYQPGEITASYDTFMGLIHPEDEKGVLMAFESHLKNNIKFDVQLRLRRKSGKYFWYRCQGQSKKNEKGEAIRMAGSLTDINDYKRAEYEREVSRKNLASFVKHAPAAVAMLDKDMDYILVSDVWLKDYKLEGSVIGQNHYEIFPEIGDDWKEQHRLVLEEGKVLTNNKDKFIRADGSVQYLQWEIRPWYQSDEIAGIIMLTNVITDIVKNEEALKKKNKQLKELAKKLTSQNTQLEDYAYITSHNLRSPVGNITALLNLYKSDPTPENLDFALTNITESANTLNQTIDNLSELFTIKKEIHKKRINLNLEEILKQTMASISQEIKSKKAIIEYDFSQATHVHFPKAYLESVMLNLLTNALKYSSPKRKPHIVFTSKNSKKFTTLTCTDNGLGINLERHGEKIFGLNKTFHRNPDARGVGLFITKAQIEAMGGTINVESTVDEGSTFTVTFLNTH